MLTVKNLALRVLNVFLGAVGIAAFTVMLVLLTVGLLSTELAAHHFAIRPAILGPVNAFLAPVYASIRAHVPSVYHGFDFAPFLIAAVMLGVCIGCDMLAHRISVYRLSLVELHKAALKAEAMAIGSIASGAAPDQMGRDEVLELYAQTKKILDAQKKNLAFLAVDVVGSTVMKQGEDPALAELDFRRYRKLVEEVIAARSFLKASWTPDGVMICFATVADAVGAGQALIAGLEKFNREVKTMKADFAVRCGVNAGDVLYDDSMKMEEMSDGSIDLAGHMQKYAAPGSIFIGAELLESQPAKMGFRPAGDKHVDGHAVYEWRKDFARSGEAAST